MTASPTDRPQKLLRLRCLMERHQAHGIALRSTESLAWLFDGARVTVPLAGAPVLAADVRMDGTVVVHASRNEVDRLTSEEIGEAVEIRPVAWFDPLPPAPAGWLDEVAVEAELRAARASLLPLERRRYSALGTEVAAAVTDVLVRARPDQTERDLAAALMRAVAGLGADPVVILVGGRTRTGIPHPLPTAGALGERAVAVVGARRHGLVVNLSRWLRFGGSPPAQEEPLLEVEAAALDATVPGQDLTDVLSSVRHAYAHHGFGKDAWLRHHQGGPTGYLGRDPKVGPLTAGPVHPGQAFAWNPWVPGYKLEDTVVVDHDAVEVLTHDPRWPTVAVAGRARPLEIEL